MASFNPERAEAPLRLPDGRVVKLAMDYQAVGALIGRLGDRWEIELGKAFDKYDCPTVCDVLQILAARYQPEMTSAEFFATAQHGTMCCWR